VRGTRFLPDAATLGNALAGFAACAMVLAGRHEMAALMIMAAVLLDSLDGALARTLDSASEMGAELDSLADMVSFGVAPGLLAGALLPPALRPWGWAVVSFYPLCAAWRLARFNTRYADPEAAHDGFCGLPSTGAGAAVATAVLICSRLPATAGARLGTLLPWLLVALGVLMISRVSYRHAGALISKLTPATAVLCAGAFVAGSIFWSYEYLFGALTWAYVASGPLLAARERIRAVRHA